MIIANIILSGLLANNIGLLVTYRWIHFCEDKAKDTLVSCVFANSELKWLSGSTNLLDSILSEQIGKKLVRL